MMTYLGCSAAGTTPWNVGVCSEIADSCQRVPVRPLGLPEFPRTSHRPAMTTATTAMAPTTSGVLLRMELLVADDPSALRHRRVVDQAGQHGREDGIAPQPTIRGGGASWCDPVMTGRRVSWDEDAETTGRILWRMNG